jgi:hypothetical protein
MFVGFGEHFHRWVQIIVGDSYEIITIDSINGDNKMRSSYFHHPPLLLRSVSAHALLRLVPLLLNRHVLALLALAVLPALQARLVAFAVFLEAV